MKLKYSHIFGALVITLVGAAQTEANDTDWFMNISGTATGGGTVTVELKESAGGDVIGSYAYTAANGDSRAKVTGGLKSQPAIRGYSHDVGNPKEEGGIMKSVFTVKALRESGTKFVVNVSEDIPGIVVETKTNLDGSVNMNTSQNSVNPGFEGTINLNGKGTTWLSDLITGVDFGQGVTTNSFQVLADGLITAEVTVDLLSPLGPENVDVIGDFINIDGDLVTDAVITASDSPLYVTASQFFDNFDSYENGQLLDGINGWQGWLLNPAVAPHASSTFSNSPPNSIEILNNNDGASGPSTDAVNTLNGPITSGQWSFTCDQYIPSGGLGSQYFLMLNTYNDLQNPPLSWSIQLQCNLATGMVDDDFDANAPIQPLVFDTWVPIRIDIDLDNNSCDEYYNGVLMYSGNWSQRGRAQGGVPEIAALDLYGGDDMGAGPFGSAYYDNLVLAEIPSGGCVPPTSYTVFRGIQLNGTLDSFAEAGDGDVAEYNPGFTINSEEAPVWLVFEANAPNATEISVTSTAGTPGIGVRAECWDWDALEYLLLGAQEDETFNALGKHTFGPIPPACIDADGNVRWRMGWRKKGFTINYPWLVSVDATSACN